MGSKHGVPSAERLDIEMTRAAMKAALIDQPCTDFLKVPPCSCSSCGIGSKDLLPEDCYQEVCNAHDWNQKPKVKIAPEHRPATSSYSAQVSAAPDLPSEQ